MTPPASHRAAWRPGRRLAAAVRSLSPAGLVAVTLALILGGTGIAGAATGGTFILGRVNTETSTATLSSSAGPPLSLSAPAGKPPLAVNRTTMIGNLNAQYTGGLTAAQLQVTGGAGATIAGINSPIGATREVVATTGWLPAGTYYVTATAMLNVAANDEGICYVAKDGNLDTSYADSSAPSTAVPYSSASLTTVLSLAAGETLQEACFTYSNSGSVLYNAGITAIRVMSSSGVIPAGAGRAVPAHRPAPVR